MKSLRTVRYSLIAAAVAGSAVVSTPALAGVSATASVASVYLWRGWDMGMGSPQVAGSLDASHDDTGLFAGIWGSSAGPGNEVDVYAGWAKTFGDFGVKAGYYKYTYPYATSTTNFDEIGLNLTFSGAFVDYYMGTGEVGSTGVDNKNNYVDFGYTMDKVTAKVGMTMNDAANTDYTHLDVTYAYNKNLSFTLSGIVDADPGATLSDLVTAADQNQDPLFVVSYTLPLDLK